MSGRDNRKPFRVVIERDFQFRFTLRICLIAGVILLVYGGIYLFIMNSNYDMLIGHAHVQMPYRAESLRREFRLFSLGLVAMMILLIGVFFVLGLVLTQRIVGPVVALRRCLRDVADGKKNVRLRLRQGDEFRNMEQLFNAAMDRVEKSAKE